MTATLTRENIIVSPENVASTVQELAREVAERFLSYTGQAVTFPAMMASFVLTPNGAFNALPHRRAFSLHNPLIWLQTSVSVLMDLADTVDFQGLGLEDSEGYALRREIDEALALARHLVVRLATDAEHFGICADAPLFAQWTTGNCKLAASHPLAD